MQFCLEKTSLSDEDNFVRFQAIQQYIKDSKRLNNSAEDSVIPVILYTVHILDDD